MVINGEKTPAFSARTLQLPPAQTDNSATIIQHTRELYSKTREEVEKAISDTIMPPENLKKQPVQSAAQSKQWPLDPSAVPVENQPVIVPAEPNRPKLVIDTPEGEAAVAAATEPAPVKKKRSRSRRKKKSPGALQETVAPDTTAENKPETPLEKPAQIMPKDPPATKKPEPKKIPQDDGTTGLLKIR